MTYSERQLTRGKRYRVAKPFVDAEGTLHDERETWYFLGSGFNRHDDELILFLASDSRLEWKLALGSRTESQSDIHDALGKYFVAIDDHVCEEYFSTSICAECEASLQIDNPRRCPSCGGVW